MKLQEELQITKPMHPGHEVALAILLTREYVNTLWERKLFGPLGITAQQYNVLRILKGGPPQGYRICDMRPRMIYRFTDVPRLIARLETVGMVKRAVDPKDKRASLIRLTPKGEALLAKLSPAHDEIASRLARSLSAAEQETLLNLLERLRDDLREDLTPASGSMGEA